jgi:hypothetical protein
MSVTAEGSTNILPSLLYVSQLKSAFPLFTQQQFSAVSTGLLLLCK